MVAKLRDEPGALSSLLSLLGTKLNLIGTTSYSTEDGSAIFSCFAEALSNAETPQSVQERASSSPFVIACEAWESIDGVLVDQFHLGIQLRSGESYLMMPRMTLAKTFTEVTRVLASGGEYLMHLEGKDFGHAFAHEYGKMLGSDPSKVVQELSSIHEALGYGSLYSSVESDGSVRLSLKDCFECSKRSNKGRSCPFTRGLVQGIIEAAYDRAMSSEETRCRQRGDKECEFKVTVETLKRSTDGHLPSVPP